RLQERGRPIRAAGAYSAARPGRRNSGSGRRPCWRGLGSCGCHECQKDARSGWRASPAAGLSARWATVAESMAATPRRNPWSPAPNRSDAAWPLTPQRSPDRCLTAAVVKGKLAHSFASGVAFGNFPALTSVEHGLAAKHGALGFGSLDAFIAALANQLALEFV